jgi:cytochrome c peroxidase
MKTFVAVVGVLVLLALAVPVANLVVGGPSGTALTKPAPTDPSVAKVSAVLETGCADCHVEGVALPFYGRLPVASGVVSKDKASGLKFFDLIAALRPGADGPSEPGLAKIEREIESGQMPPARYIALHWNAALGGGDKAAVLGWIRDVRVAQFAPAGLPREVAVRPIHPIPAKVAVDPARAALGFALYHDKRLSGDDTLSCASCHDLAKGGTDQARVSTGIRGQKGGINAPTTFNSAYQFVQFWDGRAATLQDQAAGPPENPVEMGAKFDDIVAKLTADEAFKAQFLAAYPEGITKATITDAIAQFERTLVTPDSPFDRFLQGKADALTAAQKAGWDRFQDNGCQTCHVGRLLGGRSFELMGRTGDYFKARSGETPADLGRFAVTKNEGDRNKFKVPTLRNVALTFPYFHDGSAADLKSAVKVMGEYQVGAKLNDVDAAAIVAFLESLTGTYQGKSL